MKITENKTFEPCPEFTGKAVCVDVTPLVERQGQFGTQQCFRVVFEIDMDHEERKGERHCVWSRNLTPSLNPKANLRKFLRSWFGRDLTQVELDGFDTESLLGKPAQLVVVHEHKDNETYANIAACTPDKSGAPLTPSGKFVRKQDRPDKGQGASGSSSGGGYRRAEQPAAPADETPASKVDHGAVKVHIGRCRGLDLRDLSVEQVTALTVGWLPTAKAQPKQSADDRRLIAALEWFVTEQAAHPAEAPKKEDDLPY